MVVEKYLERIEYSGSMGVSLETLKRLHEQHIKVVPFENLDIHYKHPFSLELDKVFHKVVSSRRGGFCYELNFLFNELLTRLGFQSRIIAARIFKETGELGPEYDHMSVLVSLGDDYLVDVGFGDLFITPLQINSAGVQSDGRNRFEIVRITDNTFQLSMARYSTAEKKYIFHLDEVSIDAFEAQCTDKQVNPESYFVKNTICTRATDGGRITIFNDRLIERDGDIRREWIITSDTMLRSHLEERFAIVVP